MHFNGTQCLNLKMVRQTVDNLEQIELICLLQRNFSTIMTPRYFMLGILLIFMPFVTTKKLSIEWDFYISSFFMV